MRDSDKAEGCAGCCILIVFLAVMALITACAYYVFKAAQTL